MSPVKINRSFTAAMTTDPTSDSFGLHSTAQLPLATRQPLQRERALFGETSIAPSRHR